MLTIIDGTQGYEQVTYDSKKTLKETLSYVYLFVIHCFGSKTQSDIKKKNNDFFIRSLLSILSYIVLLVIKKCKKNNNFKQLSAIGQNVG